MQKIPDKQWWQKGWTIPVSVLLHLAIVGAFFLQFPDFPTEMAEPESISVDLVPPEPEPPPPPPEPEKEPEKPEQPAAPPPPPPPPAEEATQKMPAATMPAIAIRPEPQKDDVVDNPGTSPEDDASVAEDPTELEEKPTETVTEPSEKPVENAEVETASAAAEDNPPPTAADGELAPPDPVKTEPAKKPVEAKPEKKPVEEKPVEEKAAQTPKTDAPKKLKSAKKLLSNRVIDNPGMRSMLGDLPPKRRIVQMCSIEALAQIRQVRSGSSGPDGIVPFSDKGGLISGNVLDASGGAFNVGNHWYDVTFRCEVDLDNFNVTSFQYEIGKAAVPQADVVKRGFPVP